MNSAQVGLDETPVKKCPCITADCCSHSEQNERKRENYLSWGDYFMAVACLSAQRSKDPSTQVGACVVNSENKILGIGYNGMPNGCSDDDLPWAKTSKNPLETKYPYVCHAEMNAIMNKNATDLKGCTIYVALFPCNECAKLIIQSGITRVVFLKDKPEKVEMKASKRMFDTAGIRYEQFKTSTTKQVLIDFSKSAVKCTMVTDSRQSFQVASPASDAE